ncbi:hypothetical protein TWF718_001666 [Orbilia javanica]|uniref:Uncharacterized protein n=1 Tax=Orbilia javanica TaxID=47235 RepID=A0AAN8MZ94_9PEZI
MQAPGQIYIWTAEVWGEGHAGVPSETVANVTHFHSTEVFLALRFFEDLTSTEDTFNTITVYATLKQHGTIRPFRVEPFKGTFKEKPPLWTPTVGVDEKLPLNMAARKDILAVDLAYPKLWAILGGGMYGYWDLKEVHPSFRPHGECSKPGRLGANPMERIYVDHSASIAVISQAGTRDPHPICITRYDHLVKAKGPGCNLEFGLGRVLSHAQNRFSLSPCMDTEGNRRLAMTGIGNGFTILEFNVSNIAVPYWGAQEGLNRRAISQFDKRIEQKLSELPPRAIQRKPSLDTKDMEELAGLFRTAIKDSSNGGASSELAKTDNQIAKRKNGWPFFDRFGA